MPLYFLPALILVRALLLCFGGMPVPVRMQHLTQSSTPTSITWNISIRQVRVLWGRYGPVNLLRRLARSRLAVWSILCCILITTLVYVLDEPAQRTTR